MTDEKKVGDIITDPDGTEWYVHQVIYHNGKVNYSRIRVGSMAAKMLGYEKIDTEGK